MAGERFDYEDWEGDDLPAGTRPTTSSEYLRRQEAERKLQSRKRKKEEKKRQNRVVQFGKNKATMRKIATKKGGVRGTAKILRRKRKVVRASIVAGSLCLTWYPAQFGFWVFGLVGLALEAGALSAADFAENPAAKLAAWLASKAMPGETIFVAGWIISSVGATLSLWITLGIFLAFRINPFRGSGMVTFIVLSALAFTPLGGIPWALLWMLSVYRNQGK